MKRKYAAAIVLSLFTLSTASWISFTHGNVFTMFSTYAAKVNPWDKCALGHLCKGTVDANSQTAKTSNCHAAGYEGCLTDYRDANGKFCYSIRNPDCGKTKKEIVVKPRPTPTPKPTATPTPTPTPTVTPTPTPGPTATPTPTPTPTPPQVYFPPQPRRLPPTGFPTDLLVIGAGALGAAGLFLML